MKSTVSYVALVLALSAGAAHAQSRTIAFGDSLTDNGNLAIATGNVQPGSASMRFSDGPVWVEYLSGPLANFFPLAPVNNAGNVDFAFGGARTDNALANPPSIPTQVGAFLQRGGVFGANDLVAVWGGANNIFQGIPGAAANPATAQATMGAVSTAAAGDIATTVGQIAGAGGRTILVMNLPDIGAAPAYQQPATIAASPLATYSAMTFNSTLAARLQGVAAQTGANVISVDVYSLFGAVQANPTAFGFANATTPCSALGAAACASGNYVFWDGVHPTTKAHALLARAVQQYLWAPVLAAYSASTTELSLNSRRSDAQRGLERLRDHAANPGANDFFVNVYGDLGRVGGTSNRFGYDWQLGGVHFGMTRTVGNGFTVGFAGSVNVGSVSSGSVASYDAANFAADALIGWRLGALFANAALGAGVTRFADWTRKTGIGPLENKADPSGHALSVSTEAGYDLRMGAFTLTPAARLAWIRGVTDSFKETGVVAPIDYATRTIDAVSGAVELRAAVDLSSGATSRFKAWGVIGYEDFLSYSGGSVKGRLANNTSLPFVTAVGDLPGEGMIFGAGLGGDLGAWRLNADYRASVGKDHSVRHRASLGLRSAF